MSRKLLLCALMLGLVWGGAARVRADDSMPPTPGGSARYGADPEEGDGPAPVDSEASIGANANDSFEGGSPSGGGGASKQKVAATVDEHAAGAYTGVEPGGAQVPPVPVAAGKSPATITWPGFQMRPDGTSRVFLQSTVAIEGLTSVADGQFVLKFPGAHIAGNTNRFPLETRFFNTPVTKVGLAVTREGVTLTLELRAPVTPRVSSERGPSGYFFTYLDLPAGKFLVEPPKPLGGAPALPEQGSLAPAQPEHMTTLDGSADLKPAASVKGRFQASASAHTNSDDELPPGIKSSSKTQAGGGIKLGK